MDQQSPKGRFNYVDLCKWGKNAALFAAPVLLIYGTSVLTALQDGFQLADFAISSLVAGSIFTYLISTGMDALRKLQAGPKQ